MRCFMFHVKHKLLSKLIAIINFFLVSTHSDDMDNNSGSEPSMSNLRMSLPRPKSDEFRALFGGGSP